MRRGVARTFFSSNKRWFGAPPATSPQDRSILKAAGYGASGYVWLSVAGSVSPRSVQTWSPRYVYEGIEAQSRRLADLAFMLGDYELAGQTYQAIRRYASCISPRPPKPPSLGVVPRFNAAMVYVYREFQNDKAWKYMAAAQVRAYVTITMDTSCPVLIHPSVLPPCVRRRWPGYASTMLSRYAATLIRIWSRRVRHTSRCVVPNQPVMDVFSCPRM